jgi:hypothetical protein
MGLCIDRAFYGPAGLTAPAAPAEVDELATEFVLPAAGELESPQAELEQVEVGMTEELMREVWYDVTSTLRAKVLFPHRVYSSRWVVLECSNSAA